MPRIYDFFDAGIATILSWLIIYGLAFLWLDGQPVIHNWALIPTLYFSWLLLLGE